MADTVDLFQKTLFPSFLLAGSRHASFSPPLPSILRSRLASSERAPRMCTIRAVVNARTHRNACRCGGCTSRERTLKCAPESTGAHARSSRERRGAPLPDATRFLTRSPSPSISLSVQSISPPPLLLFPFPLHVLHAHPMYVVCVCVCVENRTMGTKLYPRRFREK